LYTRELFGKEYLALSQPELYDVGYYLGLWNEKTETELKKFMRDHGCKSTVDASFLQLLAKEVEMKLISMNE